MSKLVIITSNYLRHKFFVNNLSYVHEIIGVVSETRTDYLKMEVDKKDPVIVNHFKERADKEEQYFGTDNREFNLDKDIICSIPYGDANKPEIFDWIKSKAPDYVILFGSSIIKEHILSYYKNKVINFHLGLSPYYRGTGTNFWPLVNAEPQCVGATIHYATSEVDGGDILFQIRPDVSSQDRCHDLGCKTIIKGTDAIVKIIIALQDGTIKGMRQTKSGRVYKAKDFTVNSVLKMIKNFEDGMMDEYLLNKEIIDLKYPVVDIL